MSNLVRRETLDQLIIRNEHPEYRSPMGRVLDEVKQTIYAITQNQHPATTLGGLVVTGRFIPDATQEGRSIAQIAAAAHISPIEPNHRGDTMRDVLCDLIEVGMVEVANGESPVNALLAGEEKPHFRLLPGVELTRS